MKRLLFVLIIAGGIFAVPLQAQSVVDYEDHIELCTATDTIFVFKDQVGIPDVRGGVVRLLPTGMLDYVGRPPTTALEVDPVNYGYSSAWTLCRDLTTMLGNGHDLLMNKATSPDSIFYRNPRNNDTLRYDVYGYTNDSRTAVYKNKHVD